jgi:hypothetical protein
MRRDDQIARSHHVESKSIQGMAIIKMYFYPGTDMANAMAEAVGYADRGRRPGGPTVIDSIIEKQLEAD